MRYGVSETCLDHDPGPRHPESPDRIAAIKRGLQRRHGVNYVESDPADRATVEAVHDPEYVAEFESFCEAGGGDWDPDTVATEETWDAALASAGLAIWAAQSAMDGATGRKTPFSLGRPPGHHAVTDDAMGFCFVNNAAVAAESALDGGADRVAVLDWDVHHGNGTQDIFYDRGDVCYLSVHEAALYPATGDADETGTGPGEGATVNVPLSSGAGDPEYRLVFEEVFGPVVERFDPDLLLVSAGFDAHRHDPISRLRLSTEGYGMLTDQVRTVADEADAALALVLEGGYSLDSLSESVGMVHEVFDGRRAYPDTGDPDPGVAELVADLRERHGLGAK
jgi:acetoin utilization deacetylase AcuC-like enzyme